MFHQAIILEGKDFVLEDGYIYIRLMQVHPAYQKEMRQRGEANVMTKPTLEHYLQLDKSVYSGYVRKRFPDGTNSWTHKLKYAKLGIDLIKIKNDLGTIEQKEYELKMKYREMGVDDGSDQNPEIVTAEEELPF